MSKIIIDDTNVHLHINPIIDGDQKSHGLIPRDFNIYPHGSLMYAKPFNIDLIPRNQWEDRLAFQKATNTSLNNIRNIGMSGKPIPSRDQNGKGYCWAHSSTSACLLVRAIQQEPYADLSAYAVACMIKNFRDQGGWGAESLEFIAERGIPTSKTWPQQSMSRSNDNPNTWAEAANYKVTRWMDLDPQNMEDQFFTCLLLGLPVVADYNWWSHSVCAIQINNIDVDSNGRINYNTLEGDIWNSWGNSWSENGVGAIKGRRFIPDSAIVPMVMEAA